MYKRYVERKRERESRREKRREREEERERDSFIWNFVFFEVYEFKKKTLKSHFLRRKKTNISFKYYIFKSF